MLESLCSRHGEAEVRRNLIQHEEAVALGFSTIGLALLRRLPA